jgi:hypothetical protein
MQSSDERNEPRAASGRFAIFSANGDPAWRILLGESARLPTRPGQLDGPDQIHCPAVEVGPLDQVEHNGGRPGVRPRFEFK